MPTLAEHAQIADEKMFSMLRQKTPAQRTILASNMFNSAREMLRGYLKEQHPDWTPEQIHAELRRRIHGPA
jgi:lambda repressor-like predicted transcriptional regulator